MECTYAGKRAFDIVVAAVLLLLTAPVSFVAALLTRLLGGSPVVFRQRRPGRHGEPFMILKFRTMREPEAGATRFTSDDQRLTGLGRFLRRSSIDELPSLVNVLRGDMSLVGPRPLLFEHLESGDERAHRRLAVRPGITGLAQVTGRQELTFSRRFDLDLAYIQSMSLWLDLRILLRTVVRAGLGVGVESGQSISDVDDIGAFDHG